MFLRQRNQQALDVRNEQNLDAVVAQTQGHQTGWRSDDRKRARCPAGVRRLPPIHGPLTTRRQAAQNSIFVQRKVLRSHRVPVSAEKTARLLNVHVRSSSENFAIGDVPDFDVNGDVPGGCFLPIAYR